MNVSRASTYQRLRADPVSEDRQIHEWRQNQAGGEAAHAADQANHVAKLCSTKRGRNGVRGWRCRHCGDCMGRTAGTTDLMSGSDSTSRVRTTFRTISTPVNIPQHGAATRRQEGCGGSRDLVRFDAVPAHHARHVHRRGHSGRKPNATQMLIAVALIALVQTTLKTTAVSVTKAA